VLGKKSMSQSRTLIGTVSVVKRPYKARIEIRKTSNGYSSTIILLNNTEKYLSKIVKKLINAGYSYDVSRDQFGYIHINIPNLKYYDVMFVRKIVEDILSTKGEDLAVYTN